MIPAIIDTLALAGACVYGHLDLILPGQQSKFSSDFAALFNWIMINDCIQNSLEGVIQGDPDYVEENLALISISIGNLGKVSEIGGDLQIGDTLHVPEDLLPSLRYIRDQGFGMHYHNIKEDPLAVGLMYPDCDVLALVYPTKRSHTCIEEFDSEEIISEISDFETRDPEVFARNIARQYQDHSTVVVDLRKSNISPREEMIGTLILLVPAMQYATQLKSAYDKNQKELDLFLTGNGSDRIVFISLPGPKPDDQTKLN